MKQNNVLSLDDLQFTELSSDNLQEPISKVKQNNVLTLDDLNVLDKDIGVTQAVESSLISSNDYQTDYSSFKNLRVGADNEEIRAKNQTWGQLARNSGAQTLALGIGGMISGFGYMVDLFSNLPQLVSGDEVEFNNILTKAGEGLQNKVQAIAPVYQTRRAQESGWRAMGDATWWAGNAPTLASSLAIMVPTYAATRALGAIGRAVGRGVAGATKGTSVASRLSPTLNKLTESRKARGIIDHAGNTVLSRHTYNSLEANDTYNQEYLESLQKGLSEEEAKSRAGQAAAAMYRIGYMNIWKDALQWKLILGRGAASTRATGQIMTNAATSTTARKTVESLAKRFPEGIPREAVRRIGIGATKGPKALKKIAQMGLLEGFEEINIQHQKMISRSFIDDLTGNVGEPGTGWKDVYSNLLSGYVPSLVDFVYDEDSIISPQAFDAAFWAFGSGVAMGGMMKAVQPRMDSMLGGSEAAQQAKNFAQLTYFQNQIAALQKAEVEGNKPLAEQIVDNSIFGLVVNGYIEGQTHVGGALAESRVSDLRDSLVDIISADNDKLDASGLASDPATRRHYERMLADVDYITERFENHYEKTANLSERDGRALAAQLGYQEYIQKRTSERLVDLNQQKSELQSKIDTSILPEGYDSLTDPSLKLRGAKNALKQIKENISIVEKAESEFTSDLEAHERILDQLKIGISIAESIIDETTNEIKELRESFETSTENDNVFKGLIENQDKLVDLNEFITEEQVQLDNSKKQLASLYTDKGKKKFLKQLADRISQNRNKQKQAEIGIANTKEQLKNLSSEIGTYTNETQQMFKDRSDIITERDRSIKEVKAPEVDQVLIDEVNTKVPTMDGTKFNEFLAEIDAQDIHGNTKNAIKKYATEVYNAAQNAIQNAENKILIRELRKEVEKEHKSVVDKIFSQLNKQKAVQILNSSKLDPKTKNVINRIISDYYKRREDHVPIESQEKLSDDIKAKEVSEGKKDDEQIEHTFKLEESEVEGEVEHTFKLEQEVENQEKVDSDVTPSQEEVEHTFTLEQESQQESPKQSPSVIPSARDQYGKVGNEWRLNFKLQKGKLKVTNRQADYLKNRKVKVDYHMQSHPSIKQGDTVELSLLENGNIAYTHNAHNNPIGILRAIGGNVAERTQYNIAKEALKSGQKVTAKIVKKESPDVNINNIKIDGKPFLRDITTIEENQFTRKENGSIVRENRPVIFVSSKGLVETGGAQLSINPDFYPFLDKAIIEEINRDLSDVDVTSRSGHIWMVTLNPYGKWKPLNVVTRILDSNAQAKALDFLESGNLDQANEIVNIDGNLNNQTDLELYLSAYILNEDANVFAIEYYDENINSIVKLVKNTGKKRFTVQLQDKTNPERIDEKGFREFQYKQDRNDGYKWKDGLSKLLARKRYNVDRNLIGSTNQTYTSPLTGKEHNSYYDYLTKDNVWSDPKNQKGDGNNILATDISSENGSLWSNHIISLEINQDQSPQTGKTKLKKEYTQPEVVDKKPVQEAPKKVKKSETFTMFTKEGKLGRSEGKNILKLDLINDSEAHIEFIEGNTHEGLVANHPNSFIKPIFKELNTDRSSGKIFNVTPTKVKKVGDKWKIIEKGEISYGQKLQSEKVDPKKETKVEDDMNFLDDFTEISEIETSRDKFISEAFNEHKDTFKKGNKFVTLEEFANDVFIKELFTQDQIKKHAESIAQNIINCK